MMDKPGIYTGKDGDKIKNKQPLMADRKYTRIISSTIFCTL